MGELLRVEDLRIAFDLVKGTANVVNGLTLGLEERHMIGLVGESGAGKSLFASAALGHVKKPGYLKSGKVIVDGKDMFKMDPATLRQYRGSEIALIAANARSHLNPLLRVGDQIANAYMAHNPCPKKEARARAVEMLKAVGLTDPEQRAKAYPHELSGGMAQRCMIAMALINSPRILIADDATNGLDVTVQAQIMDLILELMKVRGMSGIFITHDLGVVAQCCNEIAIMYCGQIVEFAPVDLFFCRPMHPYSRYLVNSLPEYRKESKRTSTKAADPTNLPAGCLFQPRCDAACADCGQADPPMIEVEAGHFVKCCRAAGAEKGGVSHE